jgi:hypothetical protein
MRFWPRFHRDSPPSRIDIENDSVEKISVLAGKLQASSDEYSRNVAALNFEVERLKGAKDSGSGS